MLGVVDLHLLLEFLLLRRSARAGARARAGSGSGARARARAEAGASPGPGFGRGDLRATVRAQPALQQSLLW